MTASKTAMAQGSALCITAGQGGASESVRVVLFRKTVVLRENQGFMSYGRYQVVRELGRGGMGVVYLARDPHIERSVALKVLRDDQAVGEEFVRRLLKEAKVIGRLSHPNIVTVYDVGEDEGAVYIAMEYLEGRPLDAIIRERKFTNAEIARLGIQAAEALNYAHEKGIVHRDIKPANIIVQPDWTVKIMDFGIARIEDCFATLKTQTGVLMGTPAYMSPEQVQGSKVDGRSDLFSLGIILYEMVAGERPFGRKSSNIATLLNDIVSVDPPAPSSAAGTKADPTLSAVIMRCLQKAVDNRFSTGKALADALRSGDETRIMVVRPENKGWKKYAVFASLLALLIGTLAGIFLMLPMKDSRKAESVSNVASPPSPSSISPVEEPKSPAVANETPVVAHEPAIAANEPPSAAPREAEPPPEDKSGPGAPEPSSEQRALNILSNEKNDGGLNPPSSGAGEVGPEAEQGEKSEAVASAPQAANRGMLAIESTPPGALVFLDSKRWGTTPRKEDEVPVGVHLVSCKLKGYRKWSQRVKVASGERLVIQAVLKAFPEKSPPKQVNSKNQGSDQQESGSSAPAHVAARSEAPRGSGSSERCGEIVLKASRGLRLNGEESAFYKSHCK